MEWPRGSRALVRAARVARLATCDREGWPHVVPICYVLRGEHLYSVVDAKPKRRPTALKRLRNVAENPRVAVLVDRWDEDWSRLAWVMLQGRARIVHEPAEYAAAIAALRAKYTPYRAMEFSPARNPLLALEIERVLAWSPRASSAGGR